MRICKTLVCLLMAAVLLLGLIPAQASSPEITLQSSYTLPVYGKQFTNGRYQLDIVVTNLLIDRTLLEKADALALHNRFDTNDSFEWIISDDMKDVFGSSSIHEGTTENGMPALSVSTRSEEGPSLVGKDICALQITDENGQPLTRLVFRLDEYRDAPTVNTDGSSVQTVFYTPGEELTLRIANPPTIGGNQGMVYRWFLQEDGQSRAEVTSTPSLTFTPTANDDCTTVQWWVSSDAYVDEGQFDYVGGWPNFYLLNNQAGHILMPEHEEGFWTENLYLGESYTIEVPAATSGDPSKEMEYLWKIRLNGQEEPSLVSDDPLLTVSNFGYEEGDEVVYNILVGYKGEDKSTYRNYNVNFTLCMLGERPTLKESYTFPLYLQKYLSKTDEGTLAFHLSVEDSVCGYNGFTPDSVIDELMSSFISTNFADYTYKWVVDADAKALFADDFYTTLTVRDGNNMELPYADGYAPYTSSAKNLVGKNLLSLVITHDGAPVTTFHFKVEDIILCPTIERIGSYMKYIYYTPGETLTFNAKDLVYAGGEDVTISWMVDGEVVHTGETYTFTATEAHDQLPVVFEAIVTDVAKKFSKDQSWAFVEYGFPTYYLLRSDAGHIRLPEISKQEVNLTLHKGETYTLEVPAATGAADKALEYEWRRYEDFEDYTDVAFFETTEPKLTITNSVDKETYYTYEIDVAYKGASDEDFLTYPLSIFVTMLSEENVVHVDEPSPITSVSASLMNAIQAQQGTTVATPGQLEALMVDHLENAVELDLSSPAVTADGSIGHKLVDVEVFIKTVASDGNTQRRPVTPADFADGGLLVTIPWPNGVPQNDPDCAYVVTHMFTQDSNGFKAGDIEVIEPERVDDRGLYVRINGASPMLITWIKSTATLNPVVPTTPTVPTTPAAPPATGDDTPIALFIGLMMAALLLGGMQLRKARLTK